jgi:hypothetical protein
MGMPPNIPRCMNCGYELRGLTVESSCPECNHPVWDSASHIPTTSGFAITSLVLGIVSLVGCACYGLPSIPTGIVGVVFGELASRQVKRGTRGGPSKGIALAGRICSWIGLTAGLLVLGVLIVSAYW